MSDSDNVVIIDVAARFSDQTQPGMSSAQKNVDKFAQSIQKEQRQIDSFNRTKAQVRLDAKDQASKIIKDVSASAKSLAGKTYSVTVKAVDLATSPLRKVFNFATSIQGVLTGAGIGIALDKLVAAPITLADNFTTAQIGFNTMLGSVKAGAAMMKQIQQFAIATPFSTSDVIQNTQMMMAYGFQAKDVIKDMKIIGDQAAATGKGSEGLQSIALALGQMQAHGKVDAQDMNQLTSVGVKGWDYLAKAMGKTKAQVMDLSQNGKISSDFGVQAILNGMKEFDGMMDKTANTTVSGLKSQIADTFSIDILTKWGQGLQKGAVGGLSKFNDWLGKNQSKIAKWGNQLESIGTDISENVTAKVENLADMLDSTVNGSAFQHASLTGKLSIVWGDVVATPFDKWWNGSGKKWLDDKAAGLGKGLGSGITRGMLGLLGINVVDTAKDGESVGGAFARGFSQGFDGGKIAQGFLTAFQKVFSDAGKTFTGQATSTSWLSDALLAYLGIKGIKAGATVVKGGAKAVKGIGNFASTIKGLFGKGGSTGSGGSSGTMLGVSTDLMAVKANIVYLSGSVFSSGAGASSAQGVLTAGGAAEGTAGVPLLTAGAASNVPLLTAGATGASGTAGAVTLGAAAGAAVVGTAAVTAAKAEQSRADALQKQIDKAHAEGRTAYLTGQSEGTFTKVREMLTGNYSKDNGVVTSPTKAEANARVNAAAYSYPSETISAAAPQREWYDRLFDGVLSGYNTKYAAWQKQQKQASAAQALNKERYSSAQAIYYGATGGLLSYADFAKKLGFWSSTKLINQKTGQESTGVNDKSLLSDMAKQYNAQLKNSIDISPSISISVRLDSSGNVIGVSTAGTSAAGKTAVVHGTRNRLSQYAQGGIFSSPHVGLFAEDGPEGIIPLSAAKRARGLDLWQQAGSALGVRAYADGGIVGGSAPAARGGPLVQVTIEHIDAGGNIDKQALAESIALEISKRLERVWSNMPKVG